MYFYEHLKLGRWSPVTVADAPSVVTIGGKTRLKGANGLGPEVRSIREVPADLQHLTLDQLAECFGAEGKFRAAHGGAA